MKITVDWQQQLDFIGRNERGQTITMSGGGDAVSPMEMTAMALGGCSSIDVVLILQKARQQVTGCHCEVDAKRAETDPKVFTHLHAHYVISGKDLNEKQVARAVQLSAEKYCSVAMMLNKAVELSFDYEIKTV